MSSLDQQDKIEMICSVSELTNIFHKGQNLQEFLTQVVRIVSQHMKTDVCSIYMFNKLKKRLVLQATEGLNPDMIGTLTLKLGEGLTGLALQELRSIREGRGNDSPYFKSVPESGEELFDSFLAVPIVRGIRRVGVLVLQDKQESRFTKSDAMALQAIATQLAGTLENAQLLIELPDQDSGEKEEHLHDRLIRGTTVMEGVALGNAYHLEGPNQKDHLIHIEPGNYKDGIEALREAINRTEAQLEDLQSRLEEELSDVASLIFSAHLLMLRDNGFSGNMETLIEEGEQACNAVTATANRYIRLFSSSEDLRLKEKVQDIQDLGHRILRNLMEKTDEQGDYAGQIILANKLLPSELLKLTAQKAEGFVLFGGGTTAHLSVLARSLQVPTIYTENESLFRIPSDIPMALDAGEGFLIVDPDDQAKKRIVQLIAATEYVETTSVVAKDKTFTSDGTQIHLRATINLLSDIKLANTFKAEGVGLYRSEFPFLIRNDFPSEEEQFHIYKKVIGGTNSSHITLRTLDIGGDKTLNYLPDSNESNPFLGLRAIRFLLKNKKVFVSQLKAMIRAGGRKQRVRILLPLISSLDDFLAARRYVLKSLHFLTRDGLGIHPPPLLGAMIELPSAAELAPELTKEADFISVGTNDLIQYMVGIDRTNEKVADLFDVRHPAVLRVLKRIARAAIKNSCPLCVCGIMSKDPAAIYYMIGLGIREFSIEPSKIPLMQAAISKMSAREARKSAKALSSLGSQKDIREYFQTLSIPPLSG